MGAASDKTELTSELRDEEEAAFVRASVKDVVRLLTLRGNTGLPSASSTARTTRTKFFWT